MNKLIRITLLAAGIGFIPSALWAQGGPPPWAGQGRGPAAAAVGTVPAADDLTAVERFLAMSDAELDELQAAIARVRAMSVEERAALREQIVAFRNLPAAQREQVRMGWGWHNAQDRADWRAMMQEKTPVERQAMQVELQELTPEQRTARKVELLQAWRASRPPPQP